MAKHRKPGKFRDPKHRRARVIGVASAATALAAIAGPQLLNLAEAADSTPVPADVDPFAQDVSVTDGTTVKIAAPSLRLVVTADKPVVTAGSRVTFTYTLTNTGNTAYKNIRLVDRACRPDDGFVWTGNDADPLLNVGETWKTSCSTTVTTDTTNSATVTATPVLAGGTPSPTPTVTTPTPSPTPTATGYKDGTYLGPVAHVTVPGENVAYDMQVQAVISGGKITAITVPAHTETDTTSRNIFRFQVATTASLNSDPSNPTMIYEALAAQSANIATISGATYTTGGFKLSLANALAAAQA
jgi:uncharacterized protein with FMN-binding domain